MAGIEVEPLGKCIVEFGRPLFMAAHAPDPPPGVGVGVFAPAGWVGVGVSGPGVEVGGTGGDVGVGEAVGKKSNPTRDLNFAFAKGSLVGRTGLEFGGFTLGVLVLGKIARTIDPAIKKTRAKTKALLLVIKSIIHFSGKDFTDHLHPRGKLVPR